ncbi:hypothetical protein ACFVT2_33510 [Streptomyces sp. NPDC058000]|uniref:hypothetical protein n=1 Tax=Streptomyces sp. NPDC058000 TaxID=3346299 RepID=UPI0036E4ABAE
MDIADVADNDQPGQPEQLDRPDRSGEALLEGESEGEGEGESRPGAGLTPRQARLVRVVLASVMMATMAALLVVRLASRRSVLVVGVYGAALVLCGVVIELARNGRTRLGSWLLGIGLVAAVAADLLLLP